MVLWLERQKSRFLTFYEKELFFLSEALKVRGIDFETDEVCNIFTEEVLKDILVNEEITSLDIQDNRQITLTILNFTNYSFFNFLIFITQNTRIIFLKLQDLSSILFIYTFFVANNNAIIVCASSELIMLTVFTTGTCCFSLNKFFFTKLGYPSTSF